MINVTRVKSVDSGKPNSDESKNDAMKIAVGTAHNIRYLYADTTIPIPQIVTAGRTKKDMVILSIIDGELEIG